MTVASSAGLNTQIRTVVVPCPFVFKEVSEVITALLVKSQTLREVILIQFVLARMGRLLTPRKITQVHCWALPAGVLLWAVDSHLSSNPTLKSGRKSTKKGSLL